MIIDPRIKVFLSKVIPCALGILQTCFQAPKPRDKTCKAHHTASIVLVVGADKERGSGLTPLHAAALSGNVDCIKTLLAAKASVSAVSDDGRLATPIMALLSKA